jgi:hypothetical protein
VRERREVRGSGANFSAVPVEQLFMALILEPHIHLMRPWRGRVLVHE